MLIDRLKGPAEALSLVEWRKGSGNGFCNINTQELIKENMGKGPSVLKLALHDLNLSRRGLKDCIFHSVIIHGLVFLPEK